MHQETAAQQQQQQQQQHQQNPGQDTTQPRNIAQGITVYATVQNARGVRESLLGTVGARGDSEDEWMVAFAADSGVAEQIVTTKCMQLVGSQAVGGDVDISVGAAELAEDTSTGQIDYESSFEYARLRLFLTTDTASNSLYSLEEFKGFQSALVARLRTTPTTKHKVYVAVVAGQVAAGTGRAGKLMTASTWPTKYTGFMNIVDFLESKIVGLTLIVEASLRAPSDPAAGGNTKLTTRLKLKHQRVADLLQGLAMSKANVTNFLNDTMVDCYRLLEIGNLANVLTVWSETKRRLPESVAEPTQFLHDHELQSIEAEPNAPIFALGVARQSDAAKARDGQGMSESFQL
jgi:hypothetical protein